VVATTAVPDDASIEQHRGPAPPRGTCRRTVDLLNRYGLGSLPNQPRHFLLVERLARGGRAILPPAASTLSCRHSTGLIAAVVGWRRASVLNLQHRNSFDVENAETPKKSANADGFAVPVFLRMLLVFTHGRRARHRRFALVGGVPGAQ